MATEQDKLVEAAEKENQAAKSLIEHAKAEQARVDQFRKEVLEAIRQGAATGATEALKVVMSRIEALMVENCGKATEPLTQATELAGEAAASLRKSGNFVKTWAFYGPLYLILVGGMVAGALTWYVRNFLGG